MISGHPCEPKGAPTVTRTIILTALLLGAAVPAPGAPAVYDESTLVRSWAPPRTGARTLSGKVTRTRRMAPLIIVRRTADLPREATAADLQRWLNREPVPSMRAVDQIPVASPGGPSEDAALRAAVAP